MPGTTKEWCSWCGLWVEPCIQKNIGLCPYCGETTKDLLNSVQTGPDFMDIPETVPSTRWVVKVYSREPLDEFNRRTMAGNRRTSLNQRAK